jgi:hypothetical protein
LGVLSRPGLQRKLTSEGLAVRRLVPPNLRIADSPPFDGLRTGSDTSQGERALALESGRFIAVLDDPPLVLQDNHAQPLVGKLKRCR